MTETITLYMQLQIECCTQAATIASMLIHTTRDTEIVIFLHMLATRTRHAVHGMNRHQVPTCYVQCASMRSPNGTARNHSDASCRF